MNTAELLFFSRTRIEGASGLRNPVLKFILLLSPLAFVAYQQVGRVAGWPRLDLPQVVIVAAVLWLANVLSFTDVERPRMIRRGIWGMLFFGGIYHVATTPGGLAASVGGVFWKTYSAIPVVGRILGGIAAESWLYLVFFYIAIVAVRSFTTREALWLGRRLLWSTAFMIYATVIITMAVINSELPLRLKTAWRIARDKQALLHNPYLTTRHGWFTRLGTGTWFFASTLIGNTATTATTIESLMMQRGFFRAGYRDVIGREFGAEDSAAVILLLLMLFVLVVTA